MSRLRRLVVERVLRGIRIVLLVVSVASAVLTIWRQLDPQRGGPVVVVSVVLAGIVTILEKTVPREDRDPEPPPEEVRRYGRQDLLAQVRKHWVQDLLEGPFDRLARIALGLRERPTAVDEPLPAVLRRLDKPGQQLARGTPVSTVYRDVGRQMLILGAPGAGKTTLLLELARALLDEAETISTERMPVVFHLSSWAAERGPLADWLVGELNIDYGVPLPLGRYWVSTEQVIPLLDGLDEVTEERRGDCVAAINRFHGQHGQLPLVVCSRTGEYEALQARLQLRGAVEIQPVTRADAASYLRRAGRGAAAAWAVMRDDEQLLELLTAPLFLYFVAIAYGARPEAARVSGTLEERKRRLVADYVEEMLHRFRTSTSVYPETQTTSWLAWLARAMRAHDQSLFHLDWMQPDWLPTRAQRRLVTIGVAVAAGLAGGLSNVALAILFLLVGPSLQAPGGDPGLVVPALLIFLFFGSIVGLAAYDPAIAPTDRLRWSWAALGASLPRLLLIGMSCGLLAGLAAVLGFGLVNRMDVAALAGLSVVIGLGWGLLGALFAVLGFGPVSGLRPQLSVTPAAPGQGMRTSKRNALIAGLIGGLPAALPGGLVGLLLGAAAAASSVTSQASGLEVGLVIGLNLGLHLALLFGLIAWLLRGGGAYVRHRVLRALLVRDGATPRDYIAFLEHTARLVLLRRRGGSYEFIHRLVLEHFADLDEDRPHGTCQPFRDTGC